MGLSTGGSILVRSSATGWRVQAPLFSSTSGEKVRAATSAANPRPVSSLGRICACVVTRPHGSAQKMAHHAACPDEPHGLDKCWECLSADTHSAVIRCGVPGCVPSCACALGRRQCVVSPMTGGAFCRRSCNYWIHERCYYGVDCYCSLLDQVYMIRVFSTRMCVCLRELEKNIAGCGGVSWNRRWRS